VIYGADKAIHYYYEQGFTIVGVSNQGGVEKGYKTLKNAINEQLYSLGLFPQISHIFFCPDFRGMKLYKVSLKSDNCTYEVFNRKDFTCPDKCDKLLYDSFRKPGAGMLKIAIDSLNDYPKEVLYVGDSDEDKVAAIAACPVMLLYLNSTFCSKTNMKSFTVFLY
jgi:D-glycero-D-manno-heptose 1,7-bisphosphate phosphatase